MSRYANAKDVLPSALLAQVQEHFQGMLWVPVRLKRRLKTAGDVRRNNRIVEYRASGLGTSDLAVKYSLSPQRIRQILRERKRRN